MIVLEQKPLDKIREMTRGLNSVLIVGCDGCAGVYQVGGEKQAKVMKMLLEMAAKIEKREIRIRATSVIRQCDLQMATASIRPLIEDYDAILSLGCGVGVQTLAEAFKGKLVIPANDTKFIGMQDREMGKFHEFCSACGECVLFETGGVCPVTRCAKGLMNGPCGGQVKGKCEVGGWKKDCAWVLIYDRLKERGRLDLFTKFREPKDYRLAQHPRELSPIEATEA